MRFSAFELYASKTGLSIAVFPEVQNSDYESGLAQINDVAWHIRTARNTPAKSGAFLAFWRRTPDGGTAPFGAENVGAGLLVFAERESRRGVFRFTAVHLSELGVTAGPRAGKRGFRVYPRWCIDLNPDAAATQRAQAAAFQEY